jgi:hypothetical protein
VDAMQNAWRFVEDAALRERLKEAKGIGTPATRARCLDTKMKRLLDEFGDREDVLKALTHNMYTFGWSGSRSTYFALYDQSLRELENHPLGAVRRWAKKTRAQLGREIEAAQNEDDEQHASWGL